MYRLPLFPLPSVLLPRATMPLHIFEPRYKSLVARCLEYDQPFGLMFHDSDRHGPFLTEEGRIGCLARIEEFRPLEDGRSIIVVSGEGRFRIRDALESSTSYYEAVVDDLEDATTPSGNGIADRRRRSLRLLREVTALLSSGPTKLPDHDPESDVSFLLAQMVQIDPRWYQGLLELRDEGLRLDRIDAVLRAALDTGHDAEVDPGVIDGRERM